MEDWGKKLKKSDLTLKIFFVGYILAFLCYLSIKFGLEETIKTTGLIILIFGGVWCWHKLSGVIAGKMIGE